MLAAQAVSRQSLTTEISIHSQVSPYLTGGGHSDTGPIFFLSIFPSLDNIIPPMLHTHTLTLTHTHTHSHTPTLTQSHSHSHTHTHTYCIFKDAFNRKIIGQNLGTLRPKWCPFRIWGASTKLTFAFFFNVLSNIWIQLPDVSSVCA